MKTLAWVLVILNQSQTISDVSVVISTVQRLYSMIKGDKELDEENEEFSEKFLLHGLSSSK